jgi:hypothetical protein
MIPLEGAEILGFLHFVSTRRPRLTCLVDLSVAERHALAHQFSELTFKLPDNRRRWSELFKPFLQTCRQSFTTAFDGRSINRVETVRDALARFKSIQCHGLLFYRSDHTVLQGFLRSHWHSLNQSLGDRMDLYDFLIHQDIDVGSFDSIVLERLRGIPGLSEDEIHRHGLPCLFLWSQDTCIYIGLAAHAYSEERLSRFFDSLVMNIPTGEGLLEFAADQLEELSTADLLHTNEDAGQIEPIGRDVFISYRRRDLPIAEVFRTKLQAMGVSTYIDLMIPTGERFRSRIAAEIRAAKAVVFLWTPDANKHPWVLREGMLARDSGNLFPIMISGAQPSKQLAGINFASIDSMTVSPRNIQFVSALDAVWKICGQPRVTGKPFSAEDVAADFKVSMASTKEPDQFARELHPEVLPMYVKLDQKMNKGMIESGLRRVRRSIVRHPNDQTIRKVERLYIERLAGHPRRISINYDAYKMRITEDYGGCVPEWLKLCLERYEP